MKIAFIIPFYYKWNTFSNVKAHYEYLQNDNKVYLFTKKESEGINLNKYDLIMLHGSGSYLTTEQYTQCHKPVFSFGWSDPNLFNYEHFGYCTIYFTNDLKNYRINKKYKKVIYYQTSCDKRYHKNLGLEKETEILVYGVGNHKFVQDRNETIDNLRKLGFKIKVFGRGWGKNPDTYKFIEGQRLIEEINKAKIVLDLSNETTAWAHRILEASSCGTTILTYDREDTRQMFEEGKEILLYNNFNSLVNNLTYCSEYPLTIKEIGQRAQTRCYKDHDISVRIKDLIKIMEDIK